MLNRGSKTLETLAVYIKQKQPDVKGFSAQNLWRMRQFYELYKNNEFLSPLVREINWNLSTYSNKIRIETNPEKIYKQMLKT